MNPHLTYLLLDAGTILFPLLMSFDRRVAFYQYWKQLFPGILVTGAFFIFWDVLFTRWGVWGFNDAYLIGSRMAGLPVEEWLFFVVVPYACAFIYMCLPAYLSALKDHTAGWKAFLVLGVLLLVVGVLFYSRVYTFFAFGGCGIACVLIFLLRRRLTGFMPRTFLIAYAICLVPFFIVNGILTALPVVIYNDVENLGIRLYTIPVEDTFYGMLLVLGACLRLNMSQGDGL